MKNITQRMNDLIGGVAKEKDAVVSGVKNTVARVQKNMAQDQAGVKDGSIGRYQYTNPLRK